MTYHELKEKRLNTIKLWGFSCKTNKTDLIEYLSSVLDEVFYLGVDAGCGGSAIEFKAECPKCKELIQITHTITREKLNN